MSQALYRKYRSRSLDEIVGQEHITSLLKAAIAHDKTSHAYLLTGPKGVGKTSIARIIAHEINGLAYSDESQHLDIIEIDAASNNGVEDVRDLREKVHIAPSSAAKKVYIIDEVHMLSKPAFNALLKTLEEPPAHIVFILATTDADKLPPTIISRVQRFNFRSIAPADAANHLRTIADNENIHIDDAALELIARAGRGSFRDSIGLLDQLQHAGSGDSAITQADVELALGFTSEEKITELIEAVHASDISSIAQIVNDLETAGIQPAIFTEQLLQVLKVGISTHPRDLELLDKLLDVPASSHPYIKLLSVLALHCQPASVAELPVPAKAPVALKRPEAAPAEPPAPEPEPEPQPKNTQSSKPKESPNKPSHNDKQPKPAEPVDFSWNKLISSTNGDVALKSLLAKCEHALRGSELTIYASSKFNASKLKSTKQLPKLHAALEKAGYPHVTIEISGESKPPADSQLADVAAIMGGGTEVELDSGN